MKTDKHKSSTGIPNPMPRKARAADEKSFADLQQERVEYVLQREELSKEWFENERLKKKLEVQLLHTNLNMRAIEKNIEDLNEKELVLRSEVQRRIEKKGIGRTNRKKNVSLPVIHGRKNENTSYSSKLRKSINSKASFLPPINKDLKNRTSLKIENTDRPVGPLKTNRRTS